MTEQVTFAPRGRTRPGKRAGCRGLSRKEFLVSEKRIKVWVQSFKDRPHLVLQWTDPETGRRKSKSAETADPKQADDARADLEADLNAGRHAEASRMSWERFRELFEAEYLPNCRPKTQDEYRTTFDAFERLCNPQTLRAVNERKVSAFAAELRKQPGRAKGSTGLMASTIKARLRVLNTALTWAAKQKLLPTVPKFPAVKVPKKRPQPVPAESFEKLLDKAEGPMKVFLLCGWLGGLRLGEAYALQWVESDKAPWIDFRRERIILPAEFVKSTEDGWVPLDPVLREGLLSLPRAASRVFPFTSCQGRKAIPTDGWEPNGRPLGLIALSGRIVNLAKKAGVKLTMRSLRRGFGCRYAGKVPAQVLQRLMRHANIQTTVSYYANVDAAVEEAVLGPSRNATRNSKGVGLPVESNADALSSNQESD